MESLLDLGGEHSGPWSRLCWGGFPLRAKPMSPVALVQALHVH